MQPAITQPAASWPDLGGGVVKQLSVGVGPNPAALWLVASELLFALEFPIDLHAMRSVATGSMGGMGGMGGGSVLMQLQCRTIVLNVWSNGCK